MAALLITALLLLGASQRPAGAAPVPVAKTPVARVTPVAKTPVALNAFNVRTFGYTATFSAGQNAGGGSCGYGQADDDVYGLLSMSASTSLYRNGINCGSCYRLACAGSGLCLPASTPPLTITNICAPNGPGGWCDGAKKSYSLSPQVWNGIARDPNYAVVPVSVVRVPCHRVGGITFKVVQGSAFYFSPWWAVLISNVGGSGDILSVSVQKPGSYWQPMKHSYGAVWGISQVDVTSGNPGFYFNFRITTGFRRQTIIVQNAIPATYMANLVYRSNVNFRLPATAASVRGRRTMETGDVFNATVLMRKQ